MKQVCLMQLQHGFISRWLLDTYDLTYVVQTDTEN